MEVSISTGAFYKIGYLEILDIIAETSCKNIEIFLNQAFRDVPLNNIEREISKRDLNVMSIHVPLGPLVKANEDERYWINKSISLAKVLGAKVVVTHDVSDFSVEGKIESLDAQHKRNLIDLNHGDVMVTTENVTQLPAKSFVQDSKALYDFISKNNISLTFDVTHWGSTNMPLIDGYRLFKEHIKNIHISDNMDGVEHKIFGTGNLDLKQFINKLVEDKYACPLTIELDLDNETRNDVKNREQAILALEKSVQFIKNLENNFFG